MLSSTFQQGLINLDNYEMHSEQPSTVMLGQEGDFGNKEFPRSSGMRTSQSRVTWVPL